MNTKIWHSGIVDAICNGNVKGRIVQTSACASCKVAANCHTSERKDKIVDVYGADTSGMSVGDEVVVVASEGMGWFAVVLAFVVPFLLLVTVLFLTIVFCGDELLSAAVSLFSLIPYYILLYIFRNKIRDKISFTIEGKM